MKTEINKNTLRVRDLFKTGEGLIILSLLIFLPMFVYWQTTSFGFVWDDELFYFGVYPLTINTSFEYLVKLWTEMYMGFYTPVIGTFWAMLIVIGKNFLSGNSNYNLFLFHLASILLHIFNGFLVFFLMQRFIKNRWAVLCGALIFLLHPVQVQSVSWISEQRGLLAALFGIASLNLYLSAGMRELESRKAFIKYYACAFILYILGLLAKPTVVVIPVIAGLIEIYQDKLQIKRLAARLLPWFSLMLPYIILLKSGVLKTSTPLWSRPLHWMDAINFYLYKVTFPFSLAASYARTPEYLRDQWWFYAEWIVPLLIAYFLWRFREKIPELVLAFLIFVAGFLPMSGLITFSHQFWSSVADRYIYISMVGVSLAFAYLFTWFQNKKLWFIPVIIIFALGLRSYIVQVPVWENDFTLWDHCIKISPSESRAYYNRGNSYQKKGQYPEAIKDFDRAIELNPNKADAYNNRGTAYGMMEKYDMALSDINTSLDLDPDYDDAYFNRGNLYLQTGEYDKAIKDYSRSLEINPDSHDALKNRGIIYRLKKYYILALQDFDRALKIKPKNSYIYYNRGRLYEEVKEYDKAISDYDMADSINSRDQRAFKRKAKLLEKIK